jgi:hypothetical protein
MINEIQVTTLCNKYGFRQKILNDIVLITSRNKDEWIIDCSNDPIILKHYNRRHQTSHAHIQDRRYNILNIPDALRKIDEHDYHKFNKTIHKTSRLDRLFEQIKSAK